MTNNKKPAGLEGVAKVARRIPSGAKAARDKFDERVKKAGGKIHFGREDNRKTMTVLEAAPPEKFVILWPTPPWYTNTEIVTIFDLKQVDGGTRIEVTETGFEGLELDVRQRRIDGTVDTYQRMLGKLKEYVEYKASL